MRFIDGFEESERILPSPQSPPRALCARRSGSEDFVTIKRWGEPRIIFLRRFPSYSLDLLQSLRQELRQPLRLAREAGADPLRLQHLQRRPDLPPLRQAARE